MVFKLENESTLPGLDVLDVYSNQDLGIIKRSQIQIHTHKLGEQDA